MLIDHSVVVACRLCIYSMTDNPSFSVINMTGIWQRRKFIDFVLTGIYEFLAAAVRSKWMHK